MQAPTKVSELTRILVAVGLIALLLAGCFIVLRPFLPGLLWGAMIAVASWPLMLRVQAALGGRRVMASAVMTLAFLLCVVAPLLVSVLTLVAHGSELIDWAAFLYKRPALAEAPAWVRELPMLGARLANEWHKFMQSGLSNSLREHGREISVWLVAQAGSLGALLFHFAMSLVAAAGFFLHGEKSAKVLMSLSRRLAGGRGEALVTLAGEAVRAVAIGIVVTALLQALIGGLGLLIAGVPFVGVLTSLMLILCVAQLGPSPVLVPAAIWLFWRGHVWQGTVLAVFAVLAISLDNFVRPVLIRRGANLPILLILAGVIGGLLGFGMVGLFIGPVVLALAWTLIHAWIDDRIPLVLPDAATSEIERQPQIDRP